MNTHKKVLRAFTAVLLALLMIPAYIAWAADAGDGTRTQPGDITSYCQFLDSSYVKVTDAGGRVLDSDHGVYDSVPDDANIAIYYAFSLPNDNGQPAGHGLEEYEYLAGDSIQITLPQGLKYPDAGTVSHQSIGDVTFGNGTATLKLSQGFVDQGSDLNGWIEISATLSSTTQEDASQVKIIFQTQPTTTIILNPVPVPPTAVLTKDGVYDPATNTIKWTVTVDPKDKIIPATAVLKDSYYSNQQYFDSAFTVTDAGGVTVPGNLSRDDPGHTFTYTFPGSISSKQTITYYTQPTDFGKWDEKSNGAFKNDASLTVNGVPNASAPTKIVYPKLIQKSVSSTDVNNGKITWQVAVGQGFPAGTTLSKVVIKDSASYTLGGSTKYLDADPGSMEWKGSGDTDSTSVTPVFDGTAMTITLTGVKVPGTLTYTTTVPDADMKTADANKGIAVNNTVQLSEWQTTTGPDVTVTGTAPWAQASGTVGTGSLIQKSVVSPGTNIYSDPSTNIIEWKIVINGRGIDMPAGTLEEKIEAGQTYVPHSITVTVGSTGQTNPPEPSIAPDGTFSYGFNELNGVSETVTYKTQVNKDGQKGLYGQNAYGPNGNNTNYSFSNTATLEDTGTTYDGSYSTATKRFSSQVLDKEVHTAYDAASHTVAWDITVNRDRFSLTGVKVTDDLPAGMEYVRSSVPLAVGSDTTSPIRHLVFDLGNIGDEQTITVTAKLSGDYLENWPGDGSKSFVNNAYLTATLNGEPQSTVSVSNKVDTTFPIVSKSGSYQAGYGYIDWTVEVNKAQFNLGKVVLSDTLDPALTLSRESVKIVPAVLQGGGLVPDPGQPHPLVAGTDYTVKAAPNSTDSTKTDVSITFAQPVTRAYLLTFSTDVAVDQKNIDNSISLGVIQGDGTTNNSSTQPASTVNYNINAGGSGVLGSIVVVKEDAAGTKLSGAKFVLQRLSGTQVGAEQTTDAQGRITFGSLKFYHYSLVETQAPNGYLLHDPIPVELNSTEPKEVDVVDSPALGDLSFTKYEQDGTTPLNGAEFTLYGPDGQAVATARSGAGGTAGVVKFSNVPLGDYTIRETAAPDGYLKTNTELYATVQYANGNTDYAHVDAFFTSEDGTRLAVAPSVTDSPAVIDISFTKVAAAQGGTTPLGGAVFTLHDDSNIIPDKEAPSSDSTGVVTFTGVRAGTYTVSETSVPDGNTYKAVKPFHVTVIDNGTDMSVTADIDLNAPVKDELALGSFSLTKVWPDGRTPLGGAEFTLFQGDQPTGFKAVSDAATGKATFENIPIGDYTVRETKAPDGNWELSSASLAVSVAYSADKTEVTETGTAVNATVIDYHTSNGNGGGGGGTTTGSSSTAPSSSAVSSAASSSSAASASGTAGASSAVSKAPGGGTGTVLTGPASLYIKKTDPNGRALSGAEFTLFDANGKALQKKATGASGIVVFGDLPGGSYVVKETKAPAGYKLYSGELDAALAAGQKSGYTLRDAPKGSDSDAGVLGWTSDNSLPKTGGFPIAPLAAACGLLLAAVGLVLRRRSGARGKRLKHLLPR